MENLKNSLDDTQGLESLKEDFNILGNRMIEIRNELKQSSGESGVISLNTSTEPITFTEQVFSI